MTRHVPQQKPGRSKQDYSTPKDSMRQVRRGGEVSPRDSAASTRFELASSLGPIAIELPAGADEWTDEQLSDEEIAAVFGVMAAAHWHKFQVLTKRIDRAHTWFDAIPGWGCRGLTDIGDMVQEFARGAGAKVASHYGVTGWPLPNVWLGVSVENQQTADERIPHLLKCPAAVRFVSAEPLLGPLDLRHLDADAAGHEYCQVDALTGRQTDMGRPCPDVHRIHWVIVGGESGAGARPCHVDWIRSIVRQCAGAGCACFVKQLGANVRDRNDVGFDGEPGDAWDMGARLFDAVEHDPDGVRNDYQGAPVRVHLSDRKGGDPSEWPANLRVREFPAARSAP